MYEGYILGSNSDCSSTTPRMTLGVRWTRLKSLISLVPSKVVVEALCSERKGDDQEVPSSVVVEAPCSDRKGGDQEGTEASCLQGFMDVGGGISDGLLCNVTGGSSCGVIDFVKTACVFSVTF
jgi:hypothetical protein